MAELLALALSYGVTVLVHSSALAAVVWLLDHRLRSNDAAREMVWRLVLVGSLVTAAVQIAPWGSATQPTPMAELAPAIASSPAPAGFAAALTSLAPLRADPRLLQMLGWLWLTLAAGALAHLAFGYLRLRRTLRDRVDATGLHDLAEPLAIEFGLRDTPRITVSTRAPTALALGILRPEVCVPRRALDELSADELRAMLAHELAHIRRRDPACNLLYALVCRALFWVPGLWLAQRRLAQLAELRCDAAARATQREAGLALARVLVRAAEWLTSGTKLPQHAAGSAMAASPRGLERRIRALLDAPTRTSKLGRSCTRLLSVALLVAAPITLPDTQVAAEPHAIVDVALPAPLANLVHDLATLRRDVHELRDLAISAGLLGDAGVTALFAEIDRRLLLLETRCATLVARARAAEAPANFPTTSR